MVNDWWDTKGPARCLHQLCDLRIEFLKRFFSLGGKKILDIGCGGGIFSEALWKQGAFVSGTDTCEDSLKQARSHAHYSNAHITYELPKYFYTYAQPFEVLLFMEVLEHIECLYDTLRNWLTLLSPGGYLIGSTINRTTASYFKAIIAAERVLRWIPSGTHDWHRFIQPKELNVLCQELGCIGWLQQGYKYSFFRSQKWNFCQETDTNFFFLVRKPFSDLNKKDLFLTNISDCKNL
ncbi:ubiquinone biosynthesis O-methyltransferase [Holospora obtusa F1]|uniref:Ubiquinone biosynthesis O-methyltransferase n=1 Tax=Holospora obtusa F1 TaxID=1399147 RepID=W6TG94_HOLOB|nr:bifunctional 2-polyprenyl-6-hydroxyphenol methylase/3-demethylubiquinol 3-O-methyltransferase UbiG [Holospora obtusa]ETZ06850.1 ubiquinone biosynthesis O-methyltransferase [Holospora obtusa F1]